MRLRIPSFGAELFTHTSNAHTLMESPGYGLLKDKTGIIFGALNEDSIAWSIAKAAHREGARFALSNAPVARRLGSLDKLAEKTGSPIYWADASSDEELEAAFTEAKDEFGRIDFIVHSIGMGINLRKNRAYDDLNYDWYHKTLDISAVSLHRIVHHVPGFKAPRFQVALDERREHEEKLPRTCQLAVGRMPAACKHNHSARSQSTFKHCRVAVFEARDHVSVR